MPAVSQYQAGKLLVKLVQILIVVDVISTTVRLQHKQSVAQRWLISWASHPLHWKLKLPSWLAFFPDLPHFLFFGLCINRSRRPVKNGEGLGVPNHDKMCMTAQLPASDWVLDWAESYHNQPINLAYSLTTRSLRPCSLNTTGFHVFHFAIIPIHVLVIVWLRVPHCKYWHCFDVT